MRSSSCPTEPRACVRRSGSWVEPRYLRQQATPHAPHSWVQESLVGYMVIDCLAGLASAASTCPFLEE